MLCVFDQLLVRVLQHQLLGAVENLTGTHRENSSCIANRVEEAEVVAEKMAVEMLMLSRWALSKSSHK